MESQNHWLLSFLKQAVLANDSAPMSQGKNNLFQVNQGTLLQAVGALWPTHPRKAPNKDHNKPPLFPGLPFLCSNRCQKAMNAGPVWNQIINQET